MLSEKRRSLYFLGGFLCRVHRRSYCSLSVFGDFFESSRFFVVDLLLPFPSFWSFFRLLEWFSVVPDPLSCCPNLCRRSHFFWQHFQCQGPPYSYCFWQGNPSVVPDQPSGDPLAWIFGSHAVTVTSLKTPFFEISIRSAGWVLLFFIAAAHCCLPCLCFYIAPGCPTFHPQWDPLFCCFPLAV